MNSQSECIAAKRLLGGDAYDYIVKTPWHVTFELHMPQRNSIPTGGEDQDAERTFYPLAII